jgi:hypothetical protein
MHSTPAHKQTNPAALPGQVVNPIGFSGNHDMMDDQALYRFMNSEGKHRDRTLGDYIRRKGDTVVGSIETHEGNAKSYTEVFGGVTAEEKQAVLDGQAFCARLDQPTSAMYKPVHGGFPGTSAEDFKPARDLPQGWDHV